MLESSAGAAAGPYSVAALLKMQLVTRGSVGTGRRGEGRAGERTSLRLRQMMQALPRGSADFAGALDFEWVGLGGSNDFEPEAVAPVMCTVVGARLGEQSTPESRTREKGSD